MSDNMFLTSSRRSISIFVLVLVMILQMVTPVFADDVEEDIAYLNNIAFLEKIGIIVEEDGMQYSEENVTRENFASMLGVFYGISRTEVNNYTGDGMFTDVDKKNPSAYTIETIVNAGVMDAYKDGKFRPQANLTVEQAAKAMVVLLGYGEIFSYVTTNNTDYVKQARDLELLKGVTTKSQGFITKGELIKMFAEACDTEMLQPVTYGNKMEYATVKGETLLSERLDIHKIEGILEATDVTGIGKNDACAKGYIVVNGYEIKTSQDMNMYLGMDLNVYCYGEDMEDLSLVHLFGKRKKNEEVTVLAEEIVDVRTQVITYYEGKKTKKARLSDDVTVIFNGKNNPLYTEDTFKIKNGNIRFLDADTDGKYEVVFIKSYINVWVSQVYKDSNNVFFVADKAVPDSSYTFDMDEADTRVVFKKDGSVASHSDVAKNSVISIAADKMNYQTKEVFPNASYIEILISGKSLEGPIDRVDYDELEVMVGGEIYKVDEGLNLASEGVNLGDVAKFYLDAFDKIVACEKGVNNTYGIIERIFTDDFGDAISELRIFTADGAFKKFECAKKISIDGKRYKKEDVTKINDALVAGSNKFFLETGMSRTGARPEFQVVKYSTNNDGQVTMIDTMVVNSTDTDVEKNYLHFSKKFDAQTRYFAKTNATTIAGKYLYDKNLIVFKLPNDKSKKEAYAKKSGLGSLGGYEVLPIPVFAFDANEYNYVPLVIGESETRDNVSQKEDNNMMVFEKKKIHVNEDNEIYVTLMGTSIKTGAPVTADIPQDDFASEFGSLSIEPGDIVRWTEDDLGNASSLEITMENIGPTSSIKLGTSTTGIYDTGYYSDFRITCGTVERLNDKYIIFNNGTVQGANLLNAAMKVLIYDSETRRTEVGSLAQIKTREAFPSAPSLVFTYQWYSELKSIVIFN